jgi:tetratricopeptide (TPR) repeat protein
LALRSTRSAGGRAARREEAVAAYRAALQERTRERVPLNWAATQNNLGAALHTLGGRESGPAWLEEAVAAYRAALQERTRERVPLNWAATQNNLGAALQTLGERESGTARLEEAVAAYRATLQEYTREEAVAAFEACLTVTERAWPEEWVQEVRSHRGETRAEIARRTPK